MVPQSVVLIGDTKSFSRPSRNLTFHDTVPFSGMMSGRLRGRDVPRPFFRVAEGTLEPGDRVTIRGEVNSFFQKQMATEALRKLQGIEEIDNQLIVKDH